MHSAMLRHPEGLAMAGPLPYLTLHLERKRDLSYTIFKREARNRGERFPRGSNTTFVLSCLTGSSHCLLAQSISFYHSGQVYTAMSCQASYWLHG